jgi:hypothetical protein
VPLHVSGVTYPSSGGSAQIMFGVITCVGCVEYVQVAVEPVPPLMVPVVPSLFLFVIFLNVLPGVTVHLIVRLPVDFIVLLESISGFRCEVD